MAYASERSEKMIDVFNKLWKQYHDIESCSEPSSSSKFQLKIAAAIEQASFLIKSHDKLSMFSVNESIDEIPTEDLRYFLLHALAASLDNKKQCDIKSRPALIESSLNHYNLFLKRCHDYELGEKFRIEKILIENSNDESEKTTINSSLASLSAERDAKIAKYRKSKIQAQQIKEMEDKLHDDEISRKYWILQINKWVDIACDELSSLKTELQMLIRCKDFSKNELEQSQKPSRTPMKPFILTRDKLQASVFGAGYPSLPTMTLEEFYQKEVEAGRLPDQSTLSQSSASVPDKNTDFDANEDELLKRQRDFDDWKDLHRRGAGNRKNMG